MANSFVCGDCGWEQPLHRQLGDFPEEDRPLLSQIKPGYKCSLDACPGYFVTQEEADAAEKEFNRYGPHEGQH